MDLDDQELKATRRATGIDRMIEVDSRLIDYKIEQFKHFQENLSYDEDWYFYEGQIKALQAIRDYKLGEL